MLYIMQRMIIAVALIFAPILGSESTPISVFQSKKLPNKQSISDHEQLALKEEWAVDQDIPNVLDETCIFASLDHSLDSNSTETELLELIQSNSTQSIYQENSKEALNNSEIAAVFVLRNNYWLAMSAQQAQIYCSQSQCGVAFKSVNIGNTQYTYAYIVPK